MTISFGGDNFESGGVEKKFSLATDFGATKIQTDLAGYPTSVAHQFIDELSLATINFVSVPNPLSGLLLEERYFKKENNLLKKTQFSKSIYTTSEITAVRSIFSKQEYNSLYFEPGLQSENTISNYTLAAYKVPSLRNEVTTKQTIDYIDPVPLGVTDESTYNKITSTQTYTYGVLRGLPTKITENSAGNNIETHYFYPNQVAQLTGLSGPQIDAVNYLNTQHRIATPIQVEKWFNSTKQQTIRNLYKNISYSSNFNKIVMDGIQSQKGNVTPLENRVQFYEYDTYGNPTLVGLEDGPKTKYAYNSNGQVILKIENYEAPSGSGGTIDANAVVTSANPCANSNLFATGLVTIYIYNAQSQLLEKIIDPNCNYVTYHYDPLNRLQYIKDKEGKIIQEFEINYKR